MNGTMMLHSSTHGSARVARSSTGSGRAMPRMAFSSGTCSFGRAQPQRWLQQHAQQQPSQQQPPCRRRAAVCVRADVHQSPPSAAALPASLQKIVGAFQIVPDPMARYKQLLFYAAKLPTMAAEDHVPENKVEGCVSQVWVKPELREDGRVYWTADSDSQLTKGLAALLVLGLSGCTPQEILTLQPSFIELLGLKQSLTPSRNNGFLNMLLKMQRLTLQLVSAQGNGAPAS